MALRFVHFSPRAAAASLAMSAVFVLSACSMQPPRSFPEVQLPESFTGPKSAAAVSVDTNWWHGFDSPELSALMAQLAAQNLDLATASLRVERAQFQLGQTRADNLPAVSGRLSGRGGENLDTGLTSLSSSASIGASYDVDIWGSREASILASTLNIDVSQAQLRNQSVLLQRQLANAYFTQLSLQQRLAIAKQNVTASEQLLSLIQLRYDAGSASGIELAQQRNTLLSAQNEVLRLSNQLAINNRALAALLADSEFQQREFTAPVNSLALPEIDVQQPASVLRQRPDVAAAFLQLQLADISVYQASIAGLPGLSLSADLGMSDLTDLANGWSLSAALSSAMVLFDNGKREQAERVANVDTQIAFNNLMTTIISAAQEMQDAADNYRFQREAYALDLIELENNQRLYDLAQARYKSGDSDFLNLLNAQRSWFSAQLNVINRYQSALSAAVDVYTAARGLPVTNTDS